MPTIASRSVGPLAPRILALLAITATRPTSAQQAPPADNAQGAPAVDLSVTVGVGEAVLVEFKSSAKGAISLQAGAASSKQAVQDVQNVLTIDEYRSIDKPKPKDFEGARTYVAWQHDTGKECMDPELNGMRMKLGWREGERFAELDSGMVRQSLLEREMRKADFIGLWLPLPASARVGERVELEPAQLMPLPWDEEQGQECSAQLTLVSVDAAGLAKIEGSLRATHTKAGEEPTTDTRDGKLSIALDTKLHKVTRLLRKGESLASGERAGAKFEGKLAFEIEITATRGSAVEQARSRAPNYRSRRHRIGEGQLEFELPSYWFELSTTEEGVTQYAPSRSERDKPVLLEIKLLDVGKQGSDALHKALRSALREDAGEFSEKKTSCGLGAGITYRYKSRDDTEDFHLAVYPCGEDQHVRLRLFGEREAHKRALADWPRFERTLKRAK